MRWQPNKVEEREPYTFSRGRDVMSGQVHAGENYVVICSLDEILHLGLRLNFHTVFHTLTVWLESDEDEQISDSMAM